MTKKATSNKLHNIRFFYQILKNRIVVVIVLSVLAGFLDSLGITMFLPLLQMADQHQSVPLGNLEFLMDFFPDFGKDISVLQILVVMVLLFALKSVVVYYSSIYRLQVNQQLNKQVRMDIVHQFPAFPYSEYAKMDVGQVQNIFLGEVYRLTNTFNGYINIAQGLAMIAVYTLFSFVVDWKFALLVTLLGLFSNYFFKNINTLTKQKSKRISQVNNVFAKTLIQYVNNFKYLKATGKIVDYSHTVERAIDDIQHENYQIGVLNNKVSAFREPVLILLMALVIGIQIFVFHTQMVVIMVSLLFFFRAISRIISLQASYTNTLTNQGAIDNITSFQELMQTKSEKDGSVKFNGLKDKIELKDVSFGYQSDDLILQNISFTIHRNTTIALVGDSGSGKTTLVNLIIKLLSPTSGMLEVDKLLIEQLQSRSYQSRIGYIAQEPTVFNDTIYNNVTFWAPKTPENLQRFRQSLVKARLDEFVESLSDQGDTLLGINGINLSGGQRQRISIARELYKDIDILILDEATSSLDSETENFIKESIDQLKGQLTIVIIAHRLSTVKNADQLFLMNKGKLETSGDFEELQRKSLKFRAMVDLQRI